jgi:PIN domain nuclease of toxin-antitoxin system
MSIVYLDTHIVLWLFQGKQNRLTSASKRALEGAQVRLVSPMVLLELEYLRELGRFRFSPSSRHKSVSETIVSHLGLDICNLPFRDVAGAALHLSWTRDPFDRIIVANAIANDSSPLVSGDVIIRRNYSEVVW